MKRRITTLLSAVPALILTLMLPACDIMGPSEGEFVQACLQEGQRGVNQRFSQEMGINREELCKCAASQAKSSLSPDGYRAMILEMQGKRQEAREITSRMSQDEQMAMLKGTLEMFGKCAGGG